MMTVVLILLSNPLLFGGQLKVACTKEDAIRADTEASSLKTWTEVHNSYKRFAQCDDASIGEGYSNSVAHLLSDDWGNIDKLNQLISRDKGFEKFVLRHMDELMTPTQLMNILDNAVFHCSVSSKRLCSEIIVRTKEISSHSNPH